MKITCLDANFYKIRSIFKEKKNRHCDIFFTKGSAEIDAVSTQMLKECAAWAKGRKIKVVVKGYSDRATGTHEYNKQLSDRRAHEVADYICRFGFSRKDIEIVSYGDSVQPFTENDKNRVVMIDVQEL